MIHYVVFESSSPKRDVGNDLQAEELIGMRGEQCKCQVEHSRWRRRQRRAPWLPNRTGYKKDQGRTLGVRR
jgi:hypothetical protein